MCACHDRLSIALSLLHFVRKFSIQKIKGGEKDESEQAGREGAVPSFHLHSSVNLLPPQKSEMVSKTRTQTDQNASFIKNPATCLCRVEVGRSAARLLLPQASRTLSGEVMLGPKRLVVNSVVKRK